MTNQSNKDFAFNGPLNTVSFGSCSFAILREMFKRNLTPSIFPIGGGVDLSAQKPDEKFNQWLGHCINKAQKEHSRKHTTLRLWHCNGSLESYSSIDSRLITFVETDQLTPYEINVLRNQDRVYVTSKFTQNMMSMYGINAEYLPLGFDSHNFRVLEKRPKIDGVIQFTLAGKAEQRKAHFKVLNLWAKKYGNQKEYRLNAALHNPFLKPEQLNAMISQALEGKNYWNINWVPYMPTNAEYNNYLNSSDIHLALSGGEGFDLCAYHATALGAHTVALKAHVYPDYLTDSSAVFVSPNSKRPAVDNVFFHANSAFNVGNFFDFGDEDFYAACEQAEKRAASGSNVAGTELQKQTYAQTVDVLMKDLK